LVRIGGGELGQTDQLRFDKTKWSDPPLDDPSKVVAEMRRLLAVKRAIV
jgi:hypothetical protein